ncbi:hypothetical protein [Streptacidiphilus carbonis]|uniref:hypothetical protein n=1 Tax=Streptacidiphilus carbonis TaxID=105422 RepID=UPI0005AB90A1|nr:hypothetical protein [Streptacidiphilus carbonis]
MARPAQGRRDQLARPLPTIRVKMPDQIVIMRAACGQKVAFTSRQIADAVGIAHERTGLVMGFLVSCGLLTKVSGHGIYLVNPRGARVATAWSQDESLGRVELARNLGKSWFARATLKALEGDSGTRTKVMNRLMGVAKAPEVRRAEVDLLIEWLLEARLLLPSSEEGYVHWNEQALDPIHHTPTPQAQQAPQETPLFEDVESETEASPEAVRTPPGEPTADDWVKESEPSQPKADEESKADGEAEAYIPPQREPHPEATAPTSQLSGLAQLAELATKPIRLPELIRLTEDELLALHRSLRSFATVLAAPNGESLRL